MTDAQPSRSGPESLALRRLQDAGEEAGAALGRRMRMHRTDLAAMSVIAYSPRAVGPRELADRLGISPGATTELVDRLEQAGHLVRERDTTDRRRVRLIASEHAIDEVRGQLQDLVSRLDEIAKDFSAAERGAILRYLEAAASAYRAFAAASDPNEAANAPTPSPSGSK